MNNIRKIRTEKGLKQIELAKKSGLSAASISFYENNKSIPTMKSAYKIAKALDTTIDELFFRIAEAKETVS